MHRVTVVLSGEKLEQVRDAAWDRRVSVSAWVRQAVEARLEEELGPVKRPNGSPPVVQAPTPPSEKKPVPRLFPTPAPLSPERQAVLDQFKKSPAFGGQG